MYRQRSPGGLGRLYAWKAQWGDQMSFFDFLADIPIIEYVCSNCGDILRVPVGPWHGRMLEAVSWGWRAVGESLYWCRRCATSAPGVAAALAAFAAWLRGD